MPSVSRKERYYKIEPVCYHCERIIDPNPRIGHPFVHRETRDEVCAKGGTLATPRPRKPIEGPLPLPNTR